MRFLERISQGSKFFVSTVFLTVAYLIGVGITSVIGKLVGTRFLPMDMHASTWTQFHHSGTDSTMF